MKIAIGNDHAGTEYKLAIVGLLKSMNVEVINHGTDGTDSVDYPDFIHPVAQNVEKGEVSLGIVVCGSGNGASMTANKHQGIRAALCWNEDLASLAREHNDANILCVPARFVSTDMARSMLAAFLDHSFEGGRHARRVGKISC